MILTNYEKLQYLFRISEEPSGIHILSLKFNSFETFFQIEATTVFS